MLWSLSEFLNIVEFRSYTWCFIELGEKCGFKIPPAELIYFYAQLNGTATIAGMGGEPIELAAGEIALVLSGERHTLCNHQHSVTTRVEFLEAGEYADAPPTLSLGHGRPVTRILAGRLKARWPGGQRPRNFPSVLKMRSGEAMVDFEGLVETASGSGAAAVLTRAANLLFITAFRNHPECRAAFQKFNLCDPISRAQQFIQMHPFGSWTVEFLARRVGMGRSNFAARFAREVGRTPIEFMYEERMKHAAISLEKTDMKIAEIAERVGYRSEAAFIRRFTAFFGQTPGDRRRRAQNSEQPPSNEREQASLVC